MPKVQKPKLTNRGAAGLLNKTSGHTQLATEVPEKWAHNHIASALMSNIVEIDSLVPDPRNARLHPNRNLLSIKLSLHHYRQVKPIVVRKQTNVVMAGNGTLAAAKEMGWTKIAAVFHEMTDAEAAGYGLADNRTAELAKWDFEVVAALDKLIQEANAPTIGWTIDELSVLRIANWTPPVVDENEYNGSSTEPLLVSFTPDQYRPVNEALSLIRQLMEQEKLDQADCLSQICQMWVDDTRKLMGETNAEGGTIRKEE